MAFIDYRRTNGIVTMIHAEVPPALQGRGMGAELVRGALDLVSAGGETVIPRCSFVAAYIKRHREYHALLA